MDVYNSGYVILDDDLELTFIAADSVDIAVLRFSRFYPDCGILCVFAPVKGAFS